ncbi:hypothetical protein ACFL6G_05950 [candidate division KSB1 bacterium]
MNGVSAKSGFRYQDCCCMFFLLKEYCDNLDNFDHVFIENGKIDFEIFSNNQIICYQAKISPKITAIDINTIILQFVRKKERKKLIFVFTSQPSGSIIHLFLKIRGDRCIKQYNPRTERYLKTALRGVELNNLDISYQVKTKDDIIAFIKELSRKILKITLERNDSEYKFVVLPHLIDNFFDLYRNVIENYSTQEQLKNRKIDKTALNDVINDILGKLECPINKQIKAELDEKKKIAESLKNIENFIKKSINKSPLPRADQYE